MTFKREQFHVTKLRCTATGLETVEKYLEFAAHLQQAVESGMPKDTPVRTNGAQVWAEHRLENEVPGATLTGDGFRINGRCPNYTTDLAYRKVDHPPHDYEDRGEPWHCVGGRIVDGAIHLWQESSDGSE